MSNIKRLNPGNTVNRRLLHLAADERGHRDMVALLLSNRAKVDEKDYSGLTPLHIAAKRQNEEVALELISQGADINAVDNRGETPLFKVAESSSGSAEIASLLLDHGANISARGSGVRI